MFKDPTRIHFDQSLVKNPVLLKHYDNNASSIDYETLADKILGINIYYPSLHYSFVSEDPKVLLGDMIGC